MKNTITICLFFGFRSDFKSSAKHQCHAKFAKDYAKKSGYHNKYWD